MIRIVLACLLLSQIGFAADADFNGRWVIDPNQGGPGRVAWLEIEGAGSGRITGTVVGLQPGGQVDPIAQAQVVGGELRFQVDRKTRRGMVSSVTTARLAGGELRGVTLRGDDELRWVGYPAPEIADHDDGSWVEGEPVVLFDGKDRSAWKSLHAGRDDEWSIEDGALVNSKGADEYSTKEKFWNFRLHVEYSAGEHSNSGVGLRGRYEVQIYDDYGEPATKSGNGAVYSRQAARVNASKPPGDWQTLDITLIGRDLTVLLNGVKIHDKLDVRGFTAMATDWREGEPGPITLQGDHGIVRFRKIVLTPLARK